MQDPNVIVSCKKHRVIHELPSVAHAATLVTTVEIQPWDAVVMRAINHTEQRLCFLFRSHTVQQSLHAASHSQQLRQ